MDFLTYYTRATCFAKKKKNIGGLLSLAFERAIRDGVIGIRLHRTESLPNGENFPLLIVDPTCWGSGLRSRWYEWAPKDGAMIFLFTVNAAAEAGHSNTPGP